MGTDPCSMLNEKLSSVCLGGRTFRTQSGVSHHVADRHPGCLQALKKLDPWQDRRIVFSLPKPCARRPWEQPDPLVVPDRVGAQAGTPGKISDLHSQPLSHQRRRDSYKLERTLSQVSIVPPFVDA